MKNKILISAFCILFLSVSAIADEIPSVLLEVGTNEVSLAVLNNWNIDITDLHFEINKEKFPDWLSIIENDQKITVPQGKKSPERLNLIFEVSEAPDGSFAEIPYTLKDNKGNIWDYTFKVYVGFVAESDVPAVNALHSNYPNPFNPTTTISYSLKENLHTKLVIYNTLGQEVRRLVDSTNNAGVHMVQWNGRNNNGQKVSSGLYFYKINAGSFVQTKRMMLLE